MKLDTLKELVRIVGLALGGALFGEGVAEGEQFQAALSGVVSIAAFIWWIVAKWNAARVAKELPAPDQVT